MAFRKKADAAPAPATRTPRGGAAAAKDPAAPGRGAQLKMVYKITRQRDPAVLWITLAALLAPIVVFTVVGLFVGPIYLFIPAGILIGLLLATNIFSRRVQKSAFAEMEGKPGVAAGIVDRMRGDWRVTPAVQVNRNQDLVHRVVGRPGVILIAEGRGRGPRDLLGKEVRRVRRVVGDTPVHEVVVGDGDGEVPLAKLQNTLVKMRRELKRGQVDAVANRLRAVGGPAMPIPKGPLPNARGARMR